MILSVIGVSDPFVDDFPMLNCLKGVLGSFLIKLNVLAATIRENTSLIHNPIMEVAGFAALTSTISYLVRFSIDSFRKSFSRYISRSYL